VRRAWVEYRGEAFGRLTAQIEEIRDLGDSVLVLGRFAVTGRATRIELNNEVGLILTFRDGKIASSRLIGRPRPEATTPKRPE
jgi:ketosteroid isomerase-like protein